MSRPHPRPHAETRYNLYTIFRFQRKDEPLYSTRALREALLNAFCHRDYSFQGGSVDIALYEDRLEIWSTGGLPFGLTIDDLKGNHLSRPRNPLIAEVLFRGGYIEMRGRGTNNIIDDCINAGLLEPEFIEERNSVGIRFRSHFAKETEMIEENLTSRQKEILSILAQVNEASLKVIFEKLLNPPSERMVRKDLSVMKERGMIANTGFGRGSKWMLKKEEPNKELIRQ